jgi:hypothetical protein
MSRFSGSKTPGGSGSNPPGSKTPGGSGSKTPVRRKGIWSARSKKKSNSSNTNGTAHASGGGDEEEINSMTQNRLDYYSLLGNPDVLDPSEKMENVSTQKLVDNAKYPINMGSHNTFVIWGHGCTIDKLKSFVNSGANAASLCSKNAGDSDIKQKQIFAEHSARLKLIGTKSPIKMISQTSGLQASFSPPEKVFVYTPVRFGQDMYSSWWGTNTARITPAYIKREAYVPNELYEGKYKLFEYSASGIEGNYVLPNIYVTGSKEENQVCGIKHGLSKKWIVNFKKVTNDMHGMPNTESYRHSHTFDKLVEFITAYVQSQEGQRNGTIPSEPIRIIAGFCLGGINPYIAYTQTRGLEGSLGAMSLGCASAGGGGGAISAVATTILTPKKTKKNTSVFLKKAFQLPKRKKMSLKKKKIKPLQKPTNTRVKFVLKKSTKFKAKPPKFIKRGTKKNK